jgi:malonyl-CoA/methylmalonyl-CoA synthetase
VTRTPSPLIERLAELATHDTPALLLDSEATGAGDGAGAQAAGESEGVVTHCVLAERARVVAGALGARMGGPLGGARVGILAPPGPGWVAAFLGVIQAGGVAVPLSPLHPEAEVAYFVDDADASLVLLDRSFLGRRGWFQRPVELLDELVGEPAPPLLQFADDVAVMLYTSGTTGRPKGACLTHRNVALQARLLGDAWGWSPGDRLLHALPLHHLHGLGISLMTALLAGASALMLDRFDPARFWGAMPSCSVMMAVPTMYHRLFEALDRAPPEQQARWQAGARGLRLATSGSAALPVSLARRWEALTGSIPLERFGMTEIGVGFGNPLEGPRREGTVGLPLPTVEARVVGESGADAAPGEAGEIMIRGPSVFKEYFRKETQTAAAFRDGWFLTGDTASRDEDGYVKILGRTSVDILKSGGYKLSALEIEEALRQHEAVAEVAVVGVPDPAWGDRVVAVVVAREGRAGELSTELVRAFCRDRLAPYKIPREVVVVASLPRNAVGKVVKPELLRTLTQTPR